MVKKIFNTLRDRMENGLKSLLEQISPDGRIIVVLVLLFLFATGSIYITVSSIYNMGKKSGRQIEIEHIERLGTSTEAKGGQYKPN